MKNVVVGGKLKDIEMTKGATIKIPSCKVKGGLIPKKRIWSSEFNSTDSDR
jgi:hypothetical protein